jgi:hypothetical protein
LRLVNQFMRPGTEGYFKGNDVNDADKTKVIVILIETQGVPDFPAPAQPVPPAGRRKL